MKTTNVKGSEIDFSDFKVSKEGVKVYEKSVNELEGTTFLLGKKNLEKYLYIISNNENDISKNFAGQKVFDHSLDQSFFIKECPTSNENAKALQQYFEFTKPKVLGLNYSYGFGDRIGLANPGHLKAIKNRKIGVILAQQSIREMTRTERNPDDIMSAAIWAVFQENYVEGFGADADHLKTIEDIDRLVAAGFTMFTFDPSDHVVPGVEKMSDREIEEKIKNLAWEKYG